MDARTPKFTTESSVCTRGGSRAEILHIHPESILGQWFDGVRWHIAEWELDGSYGLKEVPEYLRGRSTDKFEVFGLIQPRKPCALDLVEEYGDTKLKA